ncbi:helix-turn-helix domain-containing protein [Sporosarcina sp. FA15]|uniref:helix-turn-helix domain-containing protein n=1 Tax=Sporosarcina sp. FA15 TaxID=3413031 RepID=UPI003F656BF2
MEIKQIIGLCLFELRNEEGFSRVDFASQAGISLNAYSNIENGNSLIKLDTLEHLLATLSIPMSEFFGKIDIKKSNSTKPTSKTDTK